MKATQLKYALGIAAENYDSTQEKKDGFILHVTPTESLHYIDGELASNPTPDTVSSVDASGASQQTKVTTDNAVAASWMPFGGSNRTTPPDIRRGERVILWRYSDRDKYLWCTSGMDDHLRKLETVVWAFNGTQDESETENTADNSYFLEVSTHKGTATFSTSQTNGEFTKYTTQFNPKDGRFIVQDDHGQSVLMDATRAFIRIVNKDDTTLTIDGPNATIEANDTINFTAGKTMNLKTDQLNVTAKDINVNASDSVTINTQTLTAKGQTFAADFNSATIAGITIANGHISCAGINSSGPVTAPNID